MPVLLWMSAPYSHCSPLRVSQGFISEHTCPLWRAHTRQQAQSSRIRGTPGWHTGGSLGHWHLRGHTWDQADVNTFCGRDNIIFFVLYVQKSVSVTTPVCHMSTREKQEMFSLKIFLIIILHCMEFGDIIEIYIIYIHTVNKYLLLSLKKITHFLWKLLNFLCLVNNKSPATAEIFSVYTF